MVGLHSGGSASDASGSPDSADQPPPALASNADPAVSAAWLARSRIDTVLTTVLLLQDAARKLQAHLRIFPPPPQVRAWNIHVYYCVPTQHLPIFLFTLTSLFTKSFFLS